MGAVVSVLSGINSTKGFGDFTALRKYNSSLSYLVNISLWSWYKLWHFLEFSFINRGYFRNYIFGFRICFSSCITIAISLHSWLPKYHWLLPTSGLSLAFPNWTLLTHNWLPAPAFLKQSPVRHCHHGNVRNMKNYFLSSNNSSLFLQELLPTFVASMLSWCSPFTFPVFQCLLKNSASEILSVEITGMDFFSWQYWLIQDSEARDYKFLSFYSRAEPSQLLRAMTILLWPCFIFSNVQDRLTGIYQGSIFGLALVDGKRPSS